MSFVPREQLVEHLFLRSISGEDRTIVKVEKFVRKYDVSGERKPTQGYLNRLTNMRSREAVVLHGVIAHLINLFVRLNQSNA